MFNTATGTNPPKLSLQQVMLCVKENRGMKQMAHEIEIVFRFQTIGLIKCNDGDIKKKDFQTIEILFNKMNTMQHLILSCFETVKDLKINKIHPAFVSNDTRRLISN